MQLADSGLYSQNTHLDLQLIAGTNRTSEPGVLDPAEEHEFLFPILGRLENKEAANLGHGFEDQHTGHDRDAWEMAREKGLVDGDILQPHDSLVGFEFDDPVNEKKRIAMGQVFEHFLNVEIVTLVSI